MNKVDLSIARIRYYEKFSENGYRVAFSGGKDSIVIKELCKMAGVKCKYYYQNTTIDPPDLVYYIRKHHKDVIWNNPKNPFLVEMQTRGMPLRQGRWCCEYLKEKSSGNEFVVTGIRAEESSRRAKRHIFEQCTKIPGKKFLNPIIDWTHQDVWMFIRKLNLKYCNLYDLGWKRIGCLFCPMESAKRKHAEAKMYPKMANAFIVSLQKLKNNREQQGKNSCDAWKDGSDMFEWYISNKSTTAYVNDKFQHRFGFCQFNYANT